MVFTSQNICHKQFRAHGARIITKNIFGLRTVHYADKFLYLMPLYDAKLPVPQLQVVCMVGMGEGRAHLLIK